MIISISGTPGTGKTRVSGILAKKLGAKLISLNSFIKRNRLSESYDRKRGAMVVNPKKVSKALEKENKKIKNQEIIIDGHLSHLMRSDIVFVLRLNPKILEKRLRKKGFSKSKIIENVQSEVLDIIYAEALENKAKTMQIDATSKPPAQIAERILNTLRSKKYKSDKVDWFRKYSYYLS